MWKITHPYTLLIFTALVSSALTLPIAQKRARIAEIRREQEEALSSIIQTTNQALYLRSRRHELLHHPATIAEVALEQYGFMWTDRQAAQTYGGEKTPTQHPVSIRIVDTGCERLLGRGNYIWQLPLAATGLCAALFGLLSLFEKKSEDS